MVTYASDVLPAVDAPRSIATITAAFRADPVCRWIWPEPAQYEASFPRFIPPFAGAAFPSGSADGVDDYAGVALWLPPGVGSDEEPLIELVEESVSDALKAEVYGFVERQGELHLHEPHWYLPLIGVDPVFHGRGLGSALLRHGLGRADRDGLPAYLEATTPRNKALYERHGFVEVNVIQYGDSPPMWAMLRPPERR